MNILTLIDVFSFKPAGGAGTVMYNVSRELVKKHHHIHVICRRRKDIKKDDEIDGIKFHTFHIADSSPYVFYRNTLKKFQEIFKRIQQEKYNLDLIYTHHSLPVYALMKYIRKAKIPVVYHYHSPWPLEYKTRIIEKEDSSFVPFKNLIKFLNIRKRKNIEYKILKYVNHIFVLSLYMQKVIKKNYPKVNSQKISIIPGGVNTDKFTILENKSILRHRYKIPISGFIMLVVRSFIPRTGIDILIKSWAKIHNKINDGILLIGGTGPLEQKLKLMTKTLRLETKVRFLGFLPEKDLINYNQLADLFIMPSQTLEGFGLSAVEALSCGTPVMATPVGGLPEILEYYKKDFVFKGTDVDSIAEGILWFYNNHHNILKELPRQKIRNITIEKFGWNKSVSVIEKKIIEVLNR